MGKPADREAFTAAEARLLAREIRRGGAPRCPRCGGALAASDVRRPPEVSYVRRRTLLVCPACRASVAVDT